MCILFSFVHYLFVVCVCVCILNIYHLPTNLASRVTPSPPGLYPLKSWCVIKELVAGKLVYLFVPVTFIITSHWKTQELAYTVLG